MNSTWTNEKRKLGDLIELDKNPRQISKDEERADKAELIRNIRRIVTQLEAHDITPVWMPPDDGK